MRSIAGEAWFPQYVAAEFRVSIASQAGLDLMKLAAGNKDAADIMLRMIKFPKDMTKADLDKAL